MKIPMLDPTATKRWTLGAALLLSPCWQPALVQGAEPVEPATEAAAEREAGDASSHPLEGIPAGANDDEPTADGQLSQARAVSRLTAVPEEQGEAGGARAPDEVGKDDEQGDDSPAEKPPSAPRQQALVTFPAPLRLNRTPNSGGIFRWSKALRADPDEDPPIASAEATKALFSQSGSGVTPRVKPPVAKPKALLPAGMFSSSTRAPAAAPVQGSNSNRRAADVADANPRPAEPAEIKRSKALFNGSLFSMIEPAQSSTAAATNGQQPKALLPGPTVASGPSATVPSAILPASAPQSRALLSRPTVASGQSAAVVPINSSSLPTAPQSKALLSGPMFTGSQPNAGLPTRLPPAVEQPKALFTGSPPANGQLTPISNGQPAGAAPASSSPTGNQPKALFSGTILAKRVSPSSAAGAQPVEMPQSRALFPVLAKSTPTPAITPAPARTPTLAVPKVAAPKAEAPAEEEYNTELARSMMNGTMMTETMPSLDDLPVGSVGDSSRKERPVQKRPVKTQLLPVETQQSSDDGGATSEQPAAPKSLEKAAVAESKPSGWRSRAVTNERRSLSDSPAFKISKPPGLVLKQWTLAESAALDKPLKPIPRKAASQAPAIVIPVVKEKDKVANSVADEPKNIVQAANAQTPTVSADEPETSPAASSLTIVPRESERATELRPTPAPATASPFRKNPLR